MSAKMWEMVVKRRGLTLLEVMVSISILAIAAIAIIAALTRVMLAQSSSSHHTVARLIAESELQKSLLAGPPANPSVPSLPIRNLAMVGQSTSPTMFSTVVRWQVLPTVNEDNNPMFLSSGQQMGLLWEAKAEIWWNSEDEAKSAIERGTQSLTVSKMVYIEH